MRKSRRKEKRSWQKQEKHFKNLAQSTRLFCLKGHPVSTIIDYAANHDFDLLVIGSKGRTGLKKLLMGSVSSAVVQEVNVTFWL